MSYTEFLALCAALPVQPVSVRWHHNPASGETAWEVHVATCGEFDCLAARLPSPADRRWLNGDKQIHPHGLRTRYHMAEGEGSITHVCHGCTDDQPALLEVTA